MKAYYPVDATGNRIGLKTPEAAIYDASGTNLTTKLNNINSAINSKYSATGGVLNGDLTFPEAGSTNSSSHGINFSGSTDTARIYYKTTSQDQGNLVLKMGDDANSNINFEWNVSGNVGTKSYITSDGVYHGKATNAAYADRAGSANSVAWANISGKPSTYYTHPSYTAHASGLYKVTVDGSGHVSAVSNVTKADITALGIPGQDTNTTYGAAGSSLGLMKSGGDLTISNGVAEVISDSHVHHSVVSYGPHDEVASGTTGNAPTAGMRSSDFGMYMTQSYNDANKATPAMYGNIINVVGTGTGQLFMEWSGGNNILGRLYYRSHRDTNSGGWSRWGAVAYLDDVNKGRIGLSNVQNYDQSKAIKSITRRGTTFTATALDGTTTTFTQQDNNTTYGKATSSSDGLMSAADKAKLDGVASGANKYTHPAYTAHASGLYKVTVDAQGHVSGATAVTKADITASYADRAGSANSVAWNNVSGKPSTYTPSSHTHAISDINNLQNTINSINSNKADKSSFKNAGYYSWVTVRNDNSVSAHGTYPTSGWAELIIVLRYTDSNQTEFHSIPCIDGKPWMSYSNTNGLYLGKGDIHDAAAANFTKYGAYFNTTGQFVSGSLTAVYIYGRKPIG